MTTALPMCNPRIPTSTSLLTALSLNMSSESLNVDLKTRLPAIANIYGLGEHTNAFHLPTDNTTLTLVARCLRNSYRHKFIRKIQSILNIVIGGIIGSKKFNSWLGIISPLDLCLRGCCSYLLFSQY
jgi:hypothetical protein